MTRANDALARRRIMCIGAYTVYVVWFYWTMFYMPAWFSYDYTWLIGDVIAVVMILTSARLQPVEDQGVWSLWSASAVLYALGNVLHSMHLPSDFSHVAYVGSSIAAVSGCIHCVMIMGVPALRLVGNALSVAAFGVMLLSDLIPQRLLMSAADPGANAVSMCMNILDVGMFVGHLLLLICARRLFTVRSLLMSACFLGFIVLDQLTVAMEINNIGDTLWVNHPFWSAPYLFMGLASTYTMAMPRVPREEQQQSLVTVYLWVMLPAMACIGLLYRAMITTDLFIRVGSLTVVGVLVIVRMVIELMEACQDEWDMVKK